MFKLSDDCYVNVNEKCVYSDGKKIHISLMEMNLLNFLIAHEGEVLDKQRIISNLWPNEDDCHIDFDNLFQLIHRVRKILLICGFSDSLITVRNRGYKLILKEEDDKEEKILQADDEQEDFTETAARVESGAVNVTICNCGNNGAFFVYVHFFMLIVLLHDWNIWF